MDRTDQLKLLMDYTLFHIGVYITLSTLLISAISWKARSVQLRRYLFGTLACFIVAGISGGIVASSLPHYEKFKDFESAWLGPWFYPKALPALWWTYIEHTAFWLGIAVVLIGLWQGKIRFKPTAKTA